MGNLNNYSDEELRLVQLAAFHRMQAEKVNIQREASFIKEFPTLRFNRLSIMERAFAQIEEQK